MTSTASTVAIVAISSGATLAGSAIAGFFGFDAMRRRIAADQRLWIRTNRRDTYGRFAGKCNSALESLLTVRYGIVRRHGSADMKERWDAVNARVPEANELAGEVDLVASTTTTDAAAKLAKHLMQVKDELFRAWKEGKEPRPAEDYRTEFKPLLNEFMSAARRELDFA